MQVIRVRKRRIIIIALLLLIVGVVMYYVYKITMAIKKDSCSEEDSKIRIQKLCLRYEKGLVAGNICEDLCTTFNIKYYKCTNYRGGKTVLFTECRGRCAEGKTVKAVLKSQYSRINRDYDNYWLEEKENQKITEKRLYDIKEDLKDMIRRRLGKIDIPDDVLSFLWTTNFHDYVSNQSDVFKATNAAIRSIYSLSSQDEYMMMKSYQHLPYIPKIYGSCGEFYLLEFTPPGDALDQDIFRYTPTSWYQRANIAVQILELSRSVEADFNQPLHLCDVKGENFGVDRHNVVKLIDLDMIHLHNEMMMYYQGSCNKHKDCDVIDCKGWCNTTSGTCDGGRSNNNLQNICEDIFVDRYQNFYSGLLYYPPTDIKVKLHELLQRCAYPRNSKGSIVRQRTELDVYWELHDLLKQQITKNSKRNSKP